MSVKITYFTHGITTDNEKHLSTGWNPGKLSELGIEKCKELKDLTDLGSFDAVFSSDLKRAVDSAILYFGPDATILQDERLRECNYGELNGASDDKVVYLDHISDPFPGGESLQNVLDRVKDFSDFLSANFDDKHVAIVAHRAPQLAFEVICGNEKSLDDAIKNDWRATKAWQPGWEYIVA